MCTGLYWQILCQSSTLYYTIVQSVGKAQIAVADPGFPIGSVDPLGGRVDLLWGCGPPMQVLFGENVCENERIGSCRGGMHLAHPLDLPMTTFRQ